MQWKQNLRYLFETSAVALLSVTAGMTKVTYAFLYTSILSFNIFDVLAYGIVSFLIGYISRWRNKKSTVILILVFMLPSLVFVIKTYLTKEASYPAYEWLASAFIIPLSTFLGALLSKQVVSKTQDSKFWQAAAWLSVIAIIVVPRVYLHIKLMNEPTSLDDKGKDSSNIELFLKPDPEYPLVGFWKVKCKNSYGIAIDKVGNGFYSISFCGPGGCFKPGSWTPNSQLINDPGYRIVNNDTIEMKQQGGSITTYHRCN
jgi:hypothetical protein